MKKLKYLLPVSFVLLIFGQSCNDDDAVGTPSLDTPEITVSLTSVNFGNLDVDIESSVESISVTGEFLEADLTVSVPAGFEASLAEDSGFGTTDLTIEFEGLNEGDMVSVFVRVPATAIEGNLSGDVTLSSANASDVEVALSATIGLQISGTLMMSEYLEQYGANWETTLPLDSGILNWQLNTDTIVNQANAGGGYPETTVPNNEVFNLWYQPVPLNGTGIRSSMSISTSSSLSISGYPSVSGARNIVLTSGDESELFTWLNKNNGNCIAPNTETGNNTSIGRRFAADGYTGEATTNEVFMSALVNVSALGGSLDGSDDINGSGDIIALANATSGPSNNNTVKIVAQSDGAGGLKFGLLKENEGNPEILSETSYNLNTTYLVVLRHTFVEGDQNDVSRLYVFAEGDAIPNSLSDATEVSTIDETYSVDGVSAGVDPTDLCIVYLRERNQSVNAPEFDVTGIRVGDTWRATLFEDHTNATNSNDLTHNNRVLTNQGSDCIP